MGQIFNSLAQGLELGQNYRANRQMEKLRDIQLREEQDFEHARQKEFERTGGMPSQEGMGRSLLNRFQDWFTNRLDKRRGQAIPIGNPGAPRRGTGVALPGYAGMIDPMSRGRFSRQPPSPTGQAIPIQPFSEQEFLGRGGGAPVGLREGGMTEDEKVKRDAERARTASRAKLPPRNDAPKAEPPKSGTRRALDAAARSASSAREAGGRMFSRGNIIGGQGVLGTAGKLATRVPLLASAAGGLHGALTAESEGIEGTPDPDRPFFLDPAFYEGAAPYAAGAVRGMVNPFGIFGGGAEAAIPQETPAGPDAPPLSGPPGDGPGRALQVGVGASMSVPRGRVQDVALPELEQLSMEGIDFSDVTPDEVPDYKTDEWTEFRMGSVQMLVARGMTPAEAVNKVDQEVTAMQQRNFLSTMQQGLALQQAGNMEGAKSAYRAAYQFFPTGYDVQFVERDGKLFGVGVDESTGKVIGQPMPLDPEAVSVMISTYLDPNKFREYAKDHRDFQFRMRQYTEIDKPLAQSSANYQATMGQAAADNAATNRALAEHNMAMDTLRPTGAGGGMRPSDWDRANATFLSESKDLMLAMGISDPNQQNALASAMAEIKARRPDMQNNTIIRMVIEQATRQE